MIRSTHVLLVDRALSGCSPPQVFLSGLKAIDERGRVRRPRAAGAIGRNFVVP